MIIDEETRASPGRMEAAAAGMLLLWRLAAPPPGGWWRDWVLVVGAVWIVAALRPKSAALPTLLASAGAYLLGLYALGQFPHLVAAFGLQR